MGCHGANGSNCIHLIEPDHQTDAFAFGIMLIEMLSGTHPNEARALVDDHLFDELPNAIGDAHRANSKPTARPHALCCEWPATVLAALIDMAANCTRPTTRHRRTIAAALPELGRLSITTGLRAGD